MSKNNREILLWLLFATLCIVFFLSLSVETMESVSGHTELIGYLDQSAQVFFESFRSPFLTLLASGMTQLGSTPFLAFMTLLFAVIFLRKKDYVTSIQILASVLGSGVLTLALKVIFERSRPDIVFRLVGAEGYSYPSGHALAGAACYAVLAICSYKFSLNTNIRKFFSALFLAIIFLIGWSRIYLGVHYFSDVVAGISLGVAWAAILTAAGTYFSRRKYS
jgi:undecaprenyl-diphosphatase